MVYNVDIRCGVVIIFRHACATCRPQRTLNSLQFLQLVKCRRLQSVLFTLYPISPGSHISPGTRRDIAALVAVGRSVVEVSTSFPSEKVYILVRMVVERQVARFYKFASKALWSRRHLVSWDSWHKVPTNPSELSVRCERQAAKACLAVNL